MSFARFSYVREIGGPAEIARDADVPVALASVVKVIIGVAFARAVVAGTLDAGEVVTVPARYQIGGAGTAGTLLEAIWTDRAGPGEACALVRGWMSQVITKHGLAAAFPDGVRVASKTGAVDRLRRDFDTPGVRSGAVTA
jgi:beta-lactamase class A